MAVKLLVLVSAEGEGLPRRRDVDLLIPDFIIQRELQFVGVEIDVYGGKDLSAHNPEVQQAAEKIKLIELIDGIDAT